MEVIDCMVFCLFKMLYRRTSSASHFFFSLAIPIRIGAVLFRDVPRSG